MVFTVVAFVIGVLVVAFLPVGSATVPEANEYAYPYGSAAFAEFVLDSNRETGVRTEPFEWLERAYRLSDNTALAGYEGRGLMATLASRSRTLHATSGRTQMEIETAVWVWRIIKETIPRFSLDRGYEFVNAERFGERQCLLQSVVIAGLLQAAGLDAGVVMVWKSEAGQVSNNGHAVALVRLTDGRDLLVDASARRPKATHRGLFITDKVAHHYHFVEPEYDHNGVITAYRAADGRPLPARSTRPLDTRFLRSQFYFYRGERAPGGFLRRPATPAGLAASARYLERAVAIRPENPLAVYVLGHVYRKQGRTDAAKAQYVAAYELYRRFGYVPDGPRAAYEDATQ